MPKEKSVKNKKALTKPKEVVGKGKKKSVTPVPAGSSSSIYFPQLSNFSVNSVMKSAGVWMKDKKLMALASLAIIVVLAGIAGGVVYRKKHWFIVAMVNTRPITTVELMARIYSANKEQMIEQMVNERVVFNEAKKQGAMPTKQSIKDKVSEIEAKYGGKEEFAKVLLENGQTRDTVEMNIKTFLAMEKMYGELVTITDNDIETYIKENKLEATDEAGRREEAKNAVKEQKLTQIYREKFQELKDNANVKLF